MARKKREVMTDDTAQDRRDISTDRIGNNKRSISKFIGVALLLTLLGILVASTLIVGKTLPWKPFIIYDFYATPLTACPLEQVEVIQDIEIKGGWYSIDNLRGESYWLNDEGRPIQGTFFDVSNIPETERVEAPSNVVRTAPPVPGEWYAGGTGTLTGTRFGFVHVEQEITVEAEEPIVVKEWNDPSCIERFTRR